MQLTHFDENGKAIMVDVTEKNEDVYKRQPGESNPSSG